MKSGFIKFSKKTRSKSPNKLSQENRTVENVLQKPCSKEKQGHKKLQKKIDRTVVTLNQWAKENIGDSPPQNKAHCNNPLAMSPKESEQRIYWKYIKSKGATKSKYTKRYFEKVTTDPSAGDNDAIIKRLQEELVRNEKLFEEKLKEQKELHQRQQQRSVHVVRMCLKTIQENEERAKLIPRLEMEIARLKRQLMECRFRSPTPVRHLNAGYSGSISDYVSPLEESETDELNADDTDAVQPSTSQAIHKYFEDVIFS